MAKNSGRIGAIVAAGIVAFLCLPLLMADQPAPAEKGDSAAENAEKIAAIITCYGTIDDGLFQSIKRRGQLAVDKGASYVILDIDTYGGGVISADEISDYFILDLNKKVHTVAYVSKKAISAGSLISVHCNDIIMREHTRIGDCAPITMGGKLEGVEREKLETVIRSVFTRAAEANGYPAALLRSMVSQQIEVYRVKNTQTGEYEFFETDDLPKDSEKYDLENKERIVKEGELLTLTASEALEYGVARAVVDDIDGAIDFLAARDGVTISKNIIWLKTMWSEEMVRWLTSPMVVSLLILGVLLGVYVEFHTPGLGLPALLAVTCLVILVGSRYLIGMANWIEIALLVIGFILLLVEIFIIPGFGVAGFTGIICIIGGLLAMFIKNAPDEFPWPKGEDAWTVFTDGLAAMALGFLAFLGLAVVLARYMDRIPLLRSFVLKSAVTGKQTHVSMTTEPKPKSSPLQIGQIGEVLSTLRPAGKVRFNDDVVDAVSDGAFVEKGRQVKIEQIHGNHVVVSEIIIV